MGTVTHGIGREIDQLVDRAERDHLALKERVAGPRTPTHEAHLVDQNRRSLCGVQGLVTARWADAHLACRIAGRKVARLIHLDTSQYEEYPLDCPDCGEPMRLVLSTNERANEDPVYYSCSQWPHCKGSCPALPTGVPRGQPVSQETKQARKHLFDAIEQFWRSRGSTKNNAYGFMRKVLGLRDEKILLSELSLEQVTLIARRMEEYEGSLAEFTQGQRSNPHVLNGDHAQDAGWRIDGEDWGAFHDE